MPRARYQPRKRWCDETHHQNCSGRKCHRNLGVRPITGGQSGVGWIARCNRSNSDACYQGMLKIYIYRSHLLSFRDKIQASGQRIEYFESTQLRCGLEGTLKIPLHSNIRWGTAFKMLEQSHKLRQVSNQLLSSFQLLTSGCDHSRSYYFLHLPTRCMVQSPHYAGTIASSNIYHGRLSNWRISTGPESLMFAISLGYDTSTNFKIYIYSFHLRIQTKFNSIFMRRKSPRSGGHFLLWKNCKPHGKNSAMTAEMCFIKAHFQQDLKSWTNIISDWMRSRVLY